MFYDQRAKEIRNRLHNPSNAVIDRGIDLKRPKEPPAPKKILGEREEIKPVENLPVVELSTEIVPVEPPKPKIKISALVKIVCQYYRVREVELLSDRRTGGITLPRHIVCYLANQYLLYSLPHIGRQLHRDHTTVLHGRRRIAYLITRDEKLAAEIKDLEQIIESNFDTSISPTVSKQDMEDRKACVQE